MQRQLKLDMDSNTVFVRTSKGEDEAQSRTAHLPGDIRRALLVVDGVATYGELSKRAAPSLRASLGAMLEELERDGYIRDKSAAIHPPKMAFQPKLVVPKTKFAPPKQEISEEGKPAEDSGDLDFLTGFTPAAPRSREAGAPQPTAGEEGLRADAVEKTGLESEATLRTREEAAARLREAEREKERIAAEARAREKAARHAAAEAAAARAKAEQALKDRQEAEAVRKKGEQEAARQREAVGAGNQAASTSEAFAFESFQLEGSRPIEASHEPPGPVQKTTTPEPASAGKAGTFTFDAFEVEPAQQQPVAPAREPGPQERGGARAADAGEMPQPVQREAAPPVAETPSRAGPTDEEIERATQERIATERRLEEEALAAKKQAEAQAKAHAEAKKRAEEAAKAQFEQAARRVEHAERAPSAAKAAQVVRRRREPITLGRVLGFMLKAGFALAVLLLGVLFAVPYVMPTQDYVPKVEKFLSAKLSQPVRIGRLSGRVVPTPRLELGEVQIGSAKQLEAEQVLVDFAFRGLVIEAKPVNRVEFRGARVTGAGLQNVSTWMQRLAEDIQYPVARIVFMQGSLNSGAVQLTDVEGALNFGKIGEFTNGRLSANGGRYVLGMIAGAGGRLNVDITVRGSALPLLPKWHFDELTAKGELSSKGLSISDFRGSMLDGFLQGKANIDWRSGWTAQGALVAKTISMRHLNKLLEGDVDGSGRFRMSSGRLDALADAPVLDGSFASRKGVIHGVDVIETARTYSRGHLPGGRTHYDEMSGSLAYAGDTLRLKQVRITSNVLDATATLNIHGQEVSGSTVAKLAIEQGMKPVTLQINGTLDGPTLRFVR